MALSSLVLLNLSYIFYLAIVQCKEKMRRKALALKRKVYEDQLRRLNLVKALKLEV